MNGINGRKIPQPNTTGSVSIKNGKKMPKKEKRKVRASTVVIFVLCALTCFTLSAMFIGHEMGLGLIRERYAKLQDFENSYSVPIERVTEGDDGASEESVAVFEAPYVSPFDEELRAKNPEYICWINIPDTKVNYPVVRSSDNEKYLNTTFFGEKNKLGCLFMDYRCVGDYVPHIIIFGHNGRNGDMFGELRKYLDKKYMSEHPLISLRVNDRIVEYEVFSAKKTTVEDPAYHLDFSAPGSFSAFIERINAPKDASQIITLSTCVSAGNDKERFIVQGVHRQ